jgi:hypothetical protein
MSQLDYENAAAPSARRLASCTALLAIGWTSVMAVDPIAVFGWECVSDAGLPERNVWYLAWGITGLIAPPAVVAAATAWMLRSSVWPLLLALATAAATVSHFFHMMYMAHPLWSFESFWGLWCDDYANLLVGTGFSVLLATRLFRTAVRNP